MHSHRGPRFSHILTTLDECYGGEKVDFLELGLSADNSYGAAIPDLYDVPFITNSDAHSPDPAKCGREFTRLSLKKEYRRGCALGNKRRQYRDECRVFSGGR